MKMHWRTEFDDFQVTEKNGRNTVLGDLFVVFVFTLMMVKLGKSRKMEDCKKRENSISVARWGTNWGKINLFTPRTLWRQCDIIHFPAPSLCPVLFIWANFEFDFSMDDWATTLPSPQGVKYFRPSHCHSNCSQISPKWGSIFLRKSCEIKSVCKHPNFLSLSIPRLILLTGNF